MEQRLEYRSGAPRRARLLDRRRQMLAGRAGVIAALLVFVTTYVYGLLEYGPVLGIGLGWLPCGIAAWLAAIVVALAVHHVPPRIVAFRIQHRH